MAEHKGLTLEGARNVIGPRSTYARTKAGTGVIAVVDDGGNLMALERLDGTFAAGANISIGKARTAVLFKKPTRVFEELIKKGRTAMIALNDFTPLQGGVPIIVDGQIVGGSRSERCRQRPGGRGCGDGRCGRREQPGLLQPAGHIPWT